MNIDITWVPVVGYEGLYEVSDTGLIRAVERVYFSGKPLRPMTIKSIILKPKTDKDGYYHLGLRKNKVRKFKRVSRLVAEAFHPNPEHKRVVNHKDGFKWNNCVANLEWATLSENELHSYRSLGKNPTINMLGRTGDLSPSAKPLFQYDLSGKLVKRWGSLCLAVKAGHQKKSLYQVLSGEFKQHHGFKWSRNEN